MRTCRECQDEPSVSVFFNSHLKENFSQIRESYSLPLLSTKLLVVFFVMSPVPFVMVTPETCSENRKYKKLSSSRRRREEISIKPGWLMELSNQLTANVRPSVLQLGWEWRPKLGLRKSLGRPWRRTMGRLQRSSAKPSCASG